MVKISLEAMQNVLILKNIFMLKLAEFHWLTINFI